MHCPTFHQTIDYLDKRLTGAIAVDVHQHLATGCSFCNEDRHWYLRVKAVVAGDNSIEPPRWVINRATGLFSRGRVRGSLGERMTRAIASLVYDSLARPILVDQRSAAQVDRQMLYRAGEYSIDLMITGSGGCGTHLVGQILREGDFEFECVSGLALELVSDGQPVRSLATNSVGEFSIDGITQGRYDLRVETSEVSITIQGLPVSDC